MSLFGHVMIITNSIICTFISSLEQLFITDFEHKIFPRSEFFKTYHVV